jgi:hypothetical protein
MPCLQLQEAQPPHGARRVGMRPSVDLLADGQCLRVGVAGQIQLAQPLQDTTQVVVAQRNLWVARAGRQIAGFGGRGGCKVEALAGGRLAVFRIQNLEHAALP